MDRKYSPMSEPAKVFTEAEYKADRSGVIEHAAATGCAIVVDAHGQPKVYITIPTHDLLTLDSLD